MSPPPALSTLFAPRAVAIAGVSRRVGTVGERCLTALLRHGFAGDVYGVHPEAEEIGGVRCWPTLAELPTTPDVAVLLRPGEETIAAVRAAGERGTPWVLAGASFESAELRDRLADTARRAGTRVVGPNTEGIWDLSSRSVLSFGTVAYSDELADGPAAVVSQSGGVGAAMARILCRSGLGCSRFAATGDEVDLTVTEVLEHLVADGGLRLIAVYLEAVPELTRLRDAIEAATAAGTTVTVLKVGRSDAGARVAASHAGRMAGPDALYRSAIRAVGGVLVDSLAQLAAIARAAVVGRIAPGRGLGVVAVSGGTRAMIVDALDDCDRLRLARFAPATVERLHSVLPSYGVADNPVDVTGAILGDPALLDRCVESVAGDPDVGGVLVQLGNTQLDRLPTWIADGSAPVSGVPVWVAGLAHPELEARAERRPSLPEPALAVRALDAIATCPPDPGARRIGATAATALPRPASFLEAAALLDRIGIATPVSVAMDPSGGGTELPAPRVFVKAGNLGVAHKAAVGAVRGGVTTIADAVAAAAAIRARLGDGAEPVIAQAAVEHDLELLVAVHALGADRCIVFGAGGARTEAARDVSVCLLPAADGELRAEILRAAAGRALAPADVDVVCRAVAALADLHAALGCATLEVNPLTVVAGTPIALDFAISDEKEGTL